MCCVTRGRGGEERGGEGRGGEGREGGRGEEGGMTVIHSNRYVQYNPLTPQYLNI